MKLYDGSLHLWPTKGWICLKNAKGIGIVGRWLHWGESIDTGSKVMFPLHFATVGFCSKSAQPVGVFRPPVAPRSPPQEDSSSASSDPGSLVDSSPGVHATQALGLDFSPGTMFAAGIR